MTWATPWAAGVALLAALPLIAHLWSRHRPTRLPFPTLRFLRAASPVSRRLRRVHDWPLFLLRLAIVGAVAAAAAGPTLVASWREQAWRQRLHRVVVIDTSVADRAGEIRDRARDGAASMTSVGPGAIGELLDVAVAQATSRARRMRTEVVIAWDGARAALSPTDLAAVPRHIGLTLVPLPSRSEPPSARSADPGVVVRAQPADEPTRDRVLEALQGIAKPAAPLSIEIAWPGATPAPAPSGAVASPDLRRVIDEIAGDPRVRDAADRSVRDPRAPTVSSRPPGRSLARSIDGAPLLRGWVDGDRLVLVLDAAPTSPLALWSAVAGSESVSRPWLSAASQEPWSPSEIAAARREPVAPTEGVLPGGLDTPAAWAIALVLLAMEQWMRRARAATEPTEMVDAA